ncbi:MAG TPA: GTP 3',8-cyclase MoaA [Lentimicrobium sp.]|nr:GTP 3',8-cyclase MoaA [Lentimicrobium sp.]
MHREFSENSDIRKAEVNKLSSPVKPKMIDGFNRHINYLRISVTDRCNLRCVYCMPEDGVKMLNHNEILTFEEIIEVVKTAVQAGVSKIRITGGEPLVRRGIVDLVNLISDIPGIKDLSMTTNGILLSQFAKPLKDAGLHRINVSLDTMDPGEFKMITRGGKLEDVIKGIDCALETGLSPIKLNCVIKESSNNDHAQAVKQFGESRNIQVRFIKQMDLSAGHFSIVEGGSGGDCAHCNRLRLTANGKIKPCLFDDQEYDVRSLGAAEALRQAVTEKPACGSHNYSGEFYNIGG